MMTIAAFIFFLILADSHGLPVSVSLADLPAVARHKWLLCAP
jgi:hypothetical protein